MEIKFEIPDEKVINFSESAKFRLLEQSKIYTMEVISEAERLEYFFRENGAFPEVTDNTIFQAVRKNKFTNKKGNKLIMIIKIVGNLSSFFAGLLFVPEKFISSDNTLNLVYFIIFFFIFTIAIITMVISCIKDED